ncbi:hypothetical protein MNB_SM-6-1114 [hydrothermal vent metagenome]|uniref:Uncharacterized protein n=1 Tax=hydrothermal vent metagenome TaxID=652676 RepID=A0A1W1BKF2_9ZZZZ
MAQSLNISPRTLSDWKKGRAEVYKRLKWSYAAEQLLKELQSKNDDESAKIKELLKDG